MTTGGIPSTAIGELEQQLQLQQHGQEVQDRFLQVQSSLAHGADRLVAATATAGAATERERNLDRERDMTPAELMIEEAAAAAVQK